MQIRKTHCWLFPATTILLIGGTFYVAAPEAGAVDFGEHARGENACTAKLAFEASQKSAEAADERYKQLNEPDWEKMGGVSSRVKNPDVRDEASLEQYLSDLRVEIKTQSASAATLSPEQARRNYEQAGKQYQDLSDKSSKSDQQIYNAEAKKQKTARELEALDKKMTAAEPDKKTVAKINRAQDTKEQSSNTVTSLVGTADMALARQRVNDPNWTDFSAREVRLRKINVDNALTGSEKKTAEEALDNVIAQVRKTAKENLDEYEAATTQLNQLQKSPEFAEYVRLSNEKEQKARDLQADEKLVKTLESQKPSPKQLNDAEAKQLGALRTLREVEKLAQLKANLASAEPWITARIARNRAEESMKTLRKDYADAISYKDKQLAVAHKQMEELQTWQTNAKNHLRGREQDEEYWKEVAEIKSKSRAGYTIMKVGLEDLKCFSDVSNFLTDIDGRLKKVDAINIPIDKLEKPRIAKAPPRIKPKTRSKGKVKPTTAKKVALANFAGKWHSGGGDLDITQSGSSISGKYNWAGGTFTGTVVGRTAYIKWTQNNDREGTAKWTMAEGDNSFAGDYVYTVPASAVGKGGRWSATRISK